MSMSPDSGTDDATPTEVPVIAQEPGSPSSDEPWQASLDAGLRSDPTIQRYKSLTDFGHAFMEQRRKISEKGLILPKDDASAEQVREAMTAIGCPETAEAYDLGDFKPPEGLPWDDSVVKEMLPAFHKAGLTSQQARIVVDEFASQNAARMGTLATMSTDVEKAWGEEIRQEFGQALPVKIEAAQKAFRAATEGNEEVAKELSEARLPSGGRLGEHPGFVKMMAQIGERMGESDIPGGKGGRVGARTPAEAEARLTSLRSDKEWMERWANPEMAGHKQAADEYMELIRQMEPEEATE